MCSYSSGSAPRITPLVLSALCVTIAPRAYAATITVDSLADPGTAVECSLRSAINSVNTGSDQDGCVGGGVYGSSDTINLTVLTGTVSLASDLPSLTNDVDIVGPGADQLTIDGQVSYRSGFDISGSATANISGLTLQNGFCDDGGAIKAGASSMVAVISSTINDNSVSGGGGAIYANVNSTVTVTSCSFDGNSAGNSGGVLFNNTATVIVESSTLSGNSAPTGGGIFSIGTVTLVNSTITGNLATDAGGIYVGSGMVTATNCTIAGNSASNSAGGIANWSAASIRNTILADNTASSAPDCSGLVTSQNYNLVEDTSNCGWTSNPGDITGFDPQLGALGYWVGPTKTLPLCLTGQSSSGCGSPVSDSPAYNHIPVGGQCGGVDPYDVDQRGIARPMGTDCDIGAYESVGPTVVQLISVTARGKGSEVELSWRTASELANAGFRLQRSDAYDGQYVAISDKLIRARGGVTTEADYRYVDTSIRPAVSYWYRLEAIDTAGTTMMFGPVPVQSD